MNVTIDPRASVSPKAVLGSNVTIGPFTIVEDDVLIGDGTTIAANALIANGARLGKECRIHHGAVISNVPQDLKYAGERTTCELGDRNIVREYAVFHRGTGEGGRTVAGNDNFFMAYTHLAHDCVIGNNVIMANASMLAGHVTIEDYVIIGGLTPVHQFVHVGRHSMVGGAVRVSKDVPPFILAGNEPLVFEGLNHIGLRRRGFAKESMEALHRAYTVLYRSHLNVSQALARIQDDAVLMGCNEVRILVEFVASSKRGIIPAPRLAS
jgi:UDP-N-acetylglucosamine acyltransferase